VGCVNGCRFCATSHYFGKQYIPFLKTGKEFFDVCMEYEEKMGITDFFVLDENFFKSEQRSRELLSLMEEYKKPYSFNTFSSAETVQRLGVDFVQRIGIDFLWIGVESLHEIYEKNRGIDFQKVVQELRNQGVSVLTSGILFLEHHTKETIQQDIDYLIGLKPDFIQFMALCVAPGTTVEKEMKSESRVLDQIPYMDRHGQSGIWFKHPHFTPEESEEFLVNAFKKDFEVNGPSITRMADTYIMGAMATANASDEFMKLRHQQRLQNAYTFYPAIDALVAQAPDEKSRLYAEEVRNKYDSFFKKRSPKVHLFSAALRMALLKEKLRSKFIPNNMRQPTTLYTKYRM